MGQNKRLGFFIEVFERHPETLSIVSWAHDSYNPEAGRFVRFRGRQGWAQSPGKFQDDAPPLGEYVMKAAWMGGHEAYARAMQHDDVIATFGDMRLAESLARFYERITPASPRPGQDDSPEGW